ncbi:MAG: copper homeostasis protein CutC [Isosphaeraceae bacterium]
MRVEVCVEGADGAIAAMVGGADRVELCARDSLSVDGLTPGFEDLRRACAQDGVPVHVLIRPRAGNFEANDAEIDTMLASIATAREEGAAGVVIGVLRVDRSVDSERIARLVQAARPMSVTFHRAFDQVADPIAALEVLADLGVDRILTSGQQPSARLGLPLLKELVRQSAGRVGILAGGRIRIEDLPDLARIGIQEVHVASAVALAGRTDPAAVRAFLAAARAF